MYLAYKHVFMFVYYFDRTSRRGLTHVWF